MKNYIDVALLGGAGLTAWHLAAEMVRILHDHLHDNPGSVAIAFPKAKSGTVRKIGNVVRFFSDDRDALDQICSEIEARKAITDLVVIGRPREAPDSPKSWVAYTRFRIPSRKRQKKDTDAYYERRCQNRAQKVSRVREVPSVFMTSSKDRDNVFGLGIEIMHSQEPDLASSGRLNGYGLSSASSPVWLPEIG